MQNLVRLQLLHIPGAPSQVNPLKETRKEKLPQNFHEQHCQH